MSAKRGIKTIIGSFFRKRGQMGAEASSASFLVSIGFVIAFSCVIVSWILWKFPYHLFSDEVYNVVVVNAPKSFVEYNLSTQPDRDREAAEYGDPDDILGNYKNIISFQYSYDGYGWTKFIYKEHDAPYDFITFGKWMRENDAYLTVVFPENFDETVYGRLSDINNNDRPQVLTYYRTNSLEYYYMKYDFINEYLNNYMSYIRDDYGLAITSSSDSALIDVPIATVETVSGISAVVETLCRTFFPILLFIILLYSSMSIGTNVIAGQKERGTFTGILLTPQPRIAIVLGYLGGVVLKALIPAFFVATLSALIVGRFTIGSYIALYVYILILEIFIASITILISVINDTVISAQTAFLPVFLTFVAVCVTCIQSVTEKDDFYLYDSHREKAPIPGRHSVVHPQVALANAKHWFPVDDVMEDCIANHMFPTAPTLPRTREGWIVSRADKYCASLEWSEHYSKILETIFKYSLGPLFQVREN